MDDPTREAIAYAIGVETEFQPQLWIQIQNRFRRFNGVPTDNNRRQAYIPAGAIPVENPVGTAPAFIVEKGTRSIISLPGVPREMEYLMHSEVIPYLRNRYSLTGIIKTRILHTVGVGESHIDDLIDEQEKMYNPTVGLSAHSGQVDVRITAKANSEEEADQLIKSVEFILREKLDTWIYGTDGDKLETVAMENLKQKGWSLAVVEAGLKGNLTRRLTAVEEGFRGGEVLIELPEPRELRSLIEAYRNSHNADVGLGVAVYPDADRQDVQIVIITPQKTDFYSRPYGGPPGNAPRWALHHSLNMIRNL